MEELPICTEWGTAIGALVVDKSTGEGGDTVGKTGNGNGGEFLGTGKGSDEGGITVC